MQSILESNILQNDHFCSRYGLEGLRDSNQPDIWKTRRASNLASTARQRHCELKCGIVRKREAIPRLQRAHAVVRGLPLLQLLAAQVSNLAMTAGVGLPGMIDQRLTYVRNNPVEAGRFFHSGTLCISSATTLRTYGNFRQI